ncbi:MAG: MmcQ/YjbR family DNA-binding protein [Rhodothermales bacterium]|nr:MmcQ/YjbR family DNA-binding protein [Rhodothermales bacterium]
MTLEAFYEFATSLPEVTEDFPFGPETLVLRTRTKIFALIGVETLPLRANLKCEPERAVGLREEYEGVIPGWHMNKKHWNTVYLSSDVPGPLIRELIRHSWERVVSGMSKRDRDELLAQLSE